MKKKPGEELRRAIGAFRGAFGMVALFSFAVNLLVLAAPLYMIQVYDRVMASHSEITLLMLTIITMAAMIVMALLEFARSQVLVRVSTRLDRVMSPRMFQVAFEGAVKRPGASRQQPLGDFMNIRQFLTGNGVLAAFDAPWTPIFLLIMWAFHPLLGAITLAGAVILVGLTIASEFLTRRALAEAQAKNVVSSQLAESSLRNLEVLQAMGMFQAVAGRWLRSHDEVTVLQTIASDRAGVISSITRFVRMALQSILLGAGAWLAIKGEVSAGYVIGGSLLGGRALAPVELLIGSWKQLLSARISWARLSALLVDIPANEERMALPAPRGALVLDQVAVAAPGAAAPILRNINLAFNPGDIVGIVGPSASGKSTLARTMVGVWRPYVGKVRLDGADIWTLDRTAIGPYIGYLPQSIELFDATVAENIARFGEVEAEHVVRAATQAGIHEMILELPEGYETLIGESGHVLSGGQRQRIGLARAMYKAPPLLVLDEPNSNLDEIGEGALVAALAEMRRNGQTVIVVTHRPQLLTITTKMVVMRNGEVGASGPSEEILPRLIRPVPAPSGAPRVEAAGKA